MLEISQNLFHKLSLHIVRHPDSDTEIAIADLVKGVLCDQLSAALSASLPWHIFAKGGTISKDDGSANGRIASFSVDNEHQWALSLRVRDPSYSRRRWIYYIGLREQDEAVQLYLADEDRLAVHVVAVHEDYLAGGKSRAAVQRIAILVTSVPGIGLGVTVSGIVGDVYPFGT